jgi:hypothetical protein
MNSLKSTKGSVIDLKSINYPPPLISKSIFNYLSRLSLFSYRCLLLFLIVAGSSRNMNAQHYSLQFDGVDDFFEIPAYLSLSLDTSAFTIETWIQASSNGGNSSSSFTNSYSTLLTNRYDTLTGFLFGISQVGKLMLTLQGTSLTANHSASLFDDECHHVAVSRNGTMIRFYIDGTLVDSQTTSSVMDITTNYQMTAGYDPAKGAGYAYEGVMDDLRIWKSARTGTEIATNLTVCLTGNEPALAGNWRFDHVVMNILIDNSINLHHGEILGFAQHSNFSPTWINGRCGNNGTCPVSQLPRLMDPMCVALADPCEFVCNGGFEQVIPGTDHPNFVLSPASLQCNNQGSSVAVNWCSLWLPQGWTSPDYYIRQNTLGVYGIPINSASSTIPGGVNTWDWATNKTTNDRYIGMLKVPGLPGEGIATNLVKALDPGNYTLSLKARAFNNSNGPPITRGILNFSLTAYGQINATTINLPSQPVVNSGSWEHVQFNFTVPLLPSGIPRMENLIIQADADPGVSCTFFIDEVSIKRDPVFTPLLGTGQGSHRPQAVTTDQAGKIYITGYVYDDADFRGIAVPAPNGAMYVAKMDACNNLIWVTSEPGWWGKALAVESNGSNVYVTGHDDNYEAFIRKYNGITGAVINTVFPPFLDEGTSIIMDNSGAEILVAFQDPTDYYIHCYDLTLTPCSLFASPVGISGTCRGMVQYPAPNNDIFTCGEDLPGTGYPFVHHIARATLTHNLTANSNGTGVGSANAITVNSAGNIIVTGGMGVNTPTPSFGSCSTTANLNYQSDIFVASFDASLNCNWLTMTGDECYDEGLAICADNQDNVFVTGCVEDMTTCGNNQFSFGINGIPLVMPSQGRSLFVVKLDDSGTASWVEQTTIQSGMGTTGTGVAWNNGNLYSLSYLNGDADYGPFNLQSTGCDNTVLSRILELPALGFQRNALPGLPAKQNKPVSPEGFIRVFPNPTDGRFTVVLEGSLPGTAAGKLYDFTGRQVWEKTGTGTTLYSGNLELPGGLYNLVVRSGNKVFTHKIVMK